MDRTCTTCGKMFKIPSHLRRHLNRKTPCAPEVSAADLGEADLAKPHACPQCHRRFTTASNLTTHVRNNCKVLITRPPAAPTPAATTAELMQEIRELKAALSAASSATLTLPAPPAPTVQVANTIINVTNVTINAFGQESFDHITHERIRALLDEAIRSKQADDATSATLARAAQLIYSDREHPENITCYMPSQDVRSAMVCAGADGGRVQWRILPRDKVVSPMARRTKDLLFSKQPCVNPEQYQELMRRLCVDSPEDGRYMPKILEQNRELLARAGVLPAK